MENIQQKLGIPFFLLKMLKHTGAKYLFNIYLLQLLLSPDALSKGTIEMGVVRPCAFWFPDDNL